MASMILSLIFPSSSSLCSCERGGGGGGHTIVIYTTLVYLKQCFLINRRSRDVGICLYLYPVTEGGEGGWE